MAIGSEATGARVRAARTPAGFAPTLDRRGVRTGRERGCWIYITGSDLRACGIDVYDPPPHYQVWAAPGRPRLVVNLRPVAK
jgi:hypothetical protein